MIDLIILSTLLSGPKHGYQLKHEAGLILGQEALHNNVVYPLLRRFANNKWVSRKAVPGERGQTRQQYALTSAGRAQLVAALRTFSEQDARSADAFRFRVGMFQLLEAGIRSQIMDARQEFLQARIAKLTSIKKNFELDKYAGEVTLQLRAQTQSELKWIAHLRRLEKSGKENAVKTNKARFSN